MKRILLYITILIFLILGCKNRQSIPVDLLENDLKGPVKSCKIATYNAVDVNGKIIKGDFYKSDFSSSEEKFKLLQFRSDGLIDMISYLDEKGTFVENFRYFYNDLSLKTSEISTRFYGSFNSYDTTLYFYNSYSKLVRREWSIGSQYYGIDRNTYDNYGFMIADSTFESPWSLSNRRDYKNDERGNVIEEAFYFKYNELFSRTYRDYDSKNRKIYEAIYYPDDKELDGRYVKYNYNRFNKVQLEQRYTKEKKLWEKTVHKYNNDGNEKKSISVNLEDNINSTCTYKYEYDEKGNWIQKIFFYKSKVSTIHEREISYY